MKFIETTATRKIKALKKRIRVVQGGTSSSKTVSILLYLIAMAQSDRKLTLTSVVSESFPHLKRGAMKDFKDIMAAHNYWNDARWNASDCAYTFETGSRMEFFSADQPVKVRGPRRQRLFVNEANNIPFETFEQLEVRTEEFAFIDFNPVSEFWFFTEVLGKRDDVDHVILTYRENEALSPAIVASIERRQGRKNWWRVFGEGQLGEYEGRVYSNWQIIDDLPHEARLERRGLDFGYSNDPTAVIDIYRHNGGWILDERCYQLGMSNRAIADLLKGLPQALTYADSAEPKSIDELRLYGLTVLPADKGAGSVNQGIQFVQDQRISVTKRSVNLIKEYRNYLWLTDPAGKAVNEPEGEDHALDAVRYGFTGIWGDEDEGQAARVSELYGDEGARQDTPFNYD